jgi:hypothetical protein
VRSTRDPDGPVGAASGARRALAAAATALAAVALAAAVAGRGCGPQDDTPVGAVRALDAAARAGDRGAVYALLGPRTRDELARRAARASELGERRFSADEMIRLRGGLPVESLTDVEVVRESGGAAVVAVRGKDGSRSAIQLVKARQGWRVELLP